MLNGGFYDFTNEIKYSVIDEYDKNEFEEIIKKHLETDDYNIICLKLKKIIKNRTMFMDFLDKYNYDIKEFLTLTTRAYPNVFSKQFIRYCRENYIFKEKTFIEEL